MCFAPSHTGVSGVARRICAPSHSLLLFSPAPALFLNAEICSVDCGSHGVCMGGTCRCEEGWTGPACSQRACHPRCAEHGTCKDGKCECSQGWNGEHCTIGRPAAPHPSRAVQELGVGWFSTWKSNKGGTRSHTHSQTQTTARWLPEVGRGG